MADQTKSPKDWRKTKEFKAVRDELIDSLGDKNEKTIAGKKEKMDALTLSRVDEYLDFWVLRHQLQDDVAARGLYVKDDRDRLMENRSVSLSIQASRQMSAIAAALGLVMGAERRLEEDDL